MNKILRIIPEAMLYPLYSYYKKQLGGILSRREFMDWVDTPAFDNLLLQAS